MKKLQGQRGEMSALLVPVILLALLFVGAASFAVWAFQGRQDYKNHSDAKAATAVAANTEKVKAQDAKDFAEAAKLPLKGYSGPEQYGSIRIKYPKTWSAYVNGGSSAPVDLFFNQDFVPASGVNYNLRVRVLTSSYASVLAQFNTSVKIGQVKAVPYSLPKVKDVAGTRLDGTILPGNNSVTGAMILLPIRDKTLQVWTESSAYLPDFDNNILPNLSFSP